MPSYLAGTPDIGITGNRDLEVLGTTTLASSEPKEVTLFPGNYKTIRVSIYNQSLGKF